MQAFTTPVILTVVIAFISAVVLTIAGKLFAVPENETAGKIRECLPGANCGGCGFAGCDDYAAALAADPTLPCNMCKPGGAAAAKAIASVLGVEAGDVEEMVAVVKCSGIADVTKPEMEFQGNLSCAGAKGFFAGPGTCKFGCIGFGDCTKVCPTGAISVCNGVSRVDRDKCIGCGACAKACPQKIIDLVPKKNRVYVGCSSCDIGKNTIAACKAGCIACHMCEKTCKFDAIHIENNHAVIDYSKCKSCTMCAKACPRHIIHVIPLPGKAPVIKVDAPQVDK